MKKIFKNMIPYWKSILVIVAVLVIQAYCDLALPTYTADIIDVGIQNKGIEHVLPQEMTSEEYENSQLFMTKEEKEQWASAYEATQHDTYGCSVTDKDTLAELDSEFAIPLILDYQMSQMEEEQFKEMLAEQTGQDVSVYEQMSLEQIGQMLGAELKVSEKEVEQDDGSTQTVNCVDVRPIFEAMVASGQMDEGTVLSMRESMQDMVDSMGESMIISTGSAYAAACDEDAGLDLAKIQTAYLWKKGLQMAGLAAAMMACAIFVSYLASRVGAGVGRSLRGRLYEKVMRFSNAEMEHFSTASLITRSTNDVQQIQMVTAIFLRMLAYAPIIGIGGIIKVVQTKAGMGWLIVVAVIVILAFVMILMSVAMPKFKRMQEKVDDVNLVSREILTGLPVIRAFRREDKEEERFDGVNRELTKTMLFTNRVMTLMMPGMMLIMYALTVAIVWVAAKKIDLGVMQVGSMTAFITYAMLIVMAFLMLTMMSVMLPRAGVAAERIDEVLNMDISIKETEKPEHIENTSGILKFNHVDFTYPGSKEPAICDIDFTANPGQTTAIIGSTGCGKSTIVNLIPRLYDVTEGSITLDGTDIRELSMKDLRQQIGFVPQKGVLFSGTIASNLRFGNADASDTDVRQAAQIAQAEDFIEEKSEKYDAPIAQGGTNVSGGQKQRLAIARAIAKHPKIFVFDDSFSALDLKTDAKLRKALSDTVQDSTVIIVAQRISTILHADQILVLDEGQIVGKGTHDKLMKTCTVYQEIAKSQMSAKELGLTDGEEAEDHE
ncbi:ABC transporter ATP-binding protein [uncultured Eubacterium sp.]|uniref:ABC transporter ATP-binding protein n=1 Tax=uncultured Eubacterium sp. TaxID=165185 RepID=UPI0025CF4811|nr:ABC transporter ATP-binding protein [uncultured Eubacterium sp.]